MKQTTTRPMTMLPKHCALLCVCGSVAVGAAGCAKTDYEVGVFKPFRLLAITPPGQADNVSLTPTVRLTFSDDLAAETLSTDTVYLLDTVTATSVPCQQTYDNGDDGEGPFVVALTPTPSLTPDPTPDTQGDHPLAFSRLYALHVSTALLRRARPDKPREQIDQSGLPTEAVSRFTTEDPPPLRVLNAAPPQNSLHAAIDTNVTVTFSETLDTSSVSDTSFAVEDITDYGPTGTVAGSYSFSDSDPSKPLRKGNVAVFTPGSAFGYSRDIQVTLASALASARATDRGGNLATPVTYAFSTTDPPPLELIASTPASGVLDVATDAVVTLDFSESLSSSSVPPTSPDSIRVQDVSGSAPVDITGTWEFDTTGSTAADRLRFTPDAPWPYGGVIRVALTTGIESTRATPRGGQLASDAAVTFSIVPPPWLRLVASDPAAGQERAAPGNPLVLTFDQDVDQSTVYPSNISVVDTNATTAVAGTFDTVQDATVTFTPDAGTWPLDALIEVSLTVGLRATDAAGGGSMQAPVSFSFRVAAAPPIEVIDHTPNHGALAVSLDVTPTVTLSTAVFEPTVPTGAVTSATADLNVRLGTCTGGVYPCACADVQAVDATISYDAAALRVTYAPTTPLAASTQYELCVTTGLISLAGANPEQELQVVFTTVSANQVDSTEPASDSTDVSVTTPTRIVFKSANSLEASSVMYGSTVRVTTRDVFGRDALVSGTVTTDVSGLPHSITFTPAQDSLPGAVPAPHLLRYGAEYTVTLTDGILTDTNVPLTGGLAFSFSTVAEPPKVLSTYPEAGATGFPVVYDLLVTLSSAAHAATLTYGSDPATDNVVLRDAADAVIPLASVAVDASDARTIVIKPDWATITNGHLAYGTSHTLTLRGGAHQAPAGNPGVSTLGTDGNANPIAADCVVAFETLPALTATLVPAHADSNEPTNTAVAFELSRPINTSMLTPDRFKVVDCGTTCGVACDVTTSSASVSGLRSASSDGEAALFLPTPELASGTHWAVAILSGNGMTPFEDALGNPVDGNVQAYFCTSSSSANSGLAVRLLSPATDVASTGPVQLGLTGWMNPESATCDDVYVRKQGTEENLCRDVTHTVTTESEVAIAVSDAASDVYLQGGATYETGIRLTAANMQLNGPDALDPTATSVMTTFVVEAVSPTFSSSSPAHDTADVVAADTAVVLTFDEPMRLSSFVVPDTFNVTSSAGVQVSGALSTTGSTVTFTPDAPLAGDETYTVSMTSAVTDLGGNAALLPSDPLTFSFTIEAVAPELSSSQPPAFSGPDNLVLTFSEPLAAATLTHSTTQGVQGSVRLHGGDCGSGGNEILGTIGIDAAGSVVTFDPSPDADNTQASLGSGDYCVVVTTAVTDLGGIPLAQQIEQTVAMP